MVSPVPGKIVTPSSRPDDKPAVGFSGNLAAFKNEPFKDASTIIAPPGCCFSAKDGRKFHTMLEARLYNERGEAK